MKRMALLTGVLTLALSFLCAGLFHSGAYAANFAVTPPGYDDMGEILTSMGRQWEEISLEDLRNSAKISGYQAIFLNCDDMEVHQDAVLNLRNFVNAGGALYASDFAIEYVMAAFPGFITLYGPGEMMGMAGAEQIINADITDKGLAAFLNPTSPPSKIELDFDMGGWVVMDSVSAAVRVYLRGDVKVFTAWDGDMDFDWDGDWDDWMDQDWDENWWDEEEWEIETELITNKPLLVSFEYGKGRVIFTSFHNEPQLTALQEKLLNYLVLIPETSSLIAQAQSHLKGVYPGIDIDADFIGTINPGQTTSPVSYTAPGGKDIVFSATWPGSTLKLSVFNPNGVLHGEAKGDTPPINIPVTNAAPGAWSFTVTGESVPSDDYPYAVLAGTVTSGAPIDDDDRTPDSDDLDETDIKKKSSSSSGCFIQSLH